MFLLGEKKDFSGLYEVKREKDDANEFEIGQCFWLLFIYLFLSL